MSDHLTLLPPPQSTPGVAALSLAIRWHEDTNPLTGVTSRHFVGEVSDLTGENPVTTSVKSMEVAPGTPFKPHFLGVLGALLRAIGDRVEERMDRVEIVLPGEGQP